MCTRPRRSGSAKVDCPSPPYVVPIKLNSVSFSEIGTNCPSQNIQPAGAKLPPNIRISPTYGCAMSSDSLVWTGENSLKGDAKIQHQKRLHVQVCLAAAYIRDGRWIKRAQIGRADVRITWSGSRKQRTRRDSHCSVAT